MSIWSSAARWLALLACLLFLGLAQEARAQSTFDVAGQKLSFGTGAAETGLTVGSTRTYTNVITLSGSQIDAKVTIQALSNATVSSFDSTANPYASTDFFQPNLNITAAGGYATFKIEFLSGGNPVTLQNFYANTYDLDGAGGSASGRQFTDFSGFASYALSTGTKVTTSSVGGGTRFITTVGGNLTYAVDTDNFNTIRARVYYTSASSITISVGDTGATGAAYYGLDFSVGYAFNNVVADSTAPVVTAAQSFSYVENQAAGAAVATVAATDAIGVTAFRFGTTTTQTSSDGYYTIDNAGVVKLTASGVAAGVAQNDYDTLPNSFTQAIQAGDAAGNWSAAANITLNVTAAPPTITGPSGGAGAAASAVSVNESQTAITTLSANRAVTWSITGGADSAKFGIDSSTGAVTFLSAPDFEAPTDADANNTYVVAITATDGVGGASVQTLTVTVLDIADAPPVLTGPSGGAGAANSAISINEGATAVTTVTASEAVTWSISGGADAAKFAIDAATGALTLLAAPDYEVPTDADTNNTYVVVVTGTDGDTNAAAQTITVTVLDLDEAAPLITGPSGAAGAANSAKSINEGVTAVATLTASEIVTWSITGGADAAKFAIDGATGALSLLAAPDYEAPTDADTNNTYVVAVTATDADTNAAVQTVTVTILDLDDTAPVITGPSGAAGAATSAKSINEGVTNVATLTSSETVTWSVTGGADAAKFAINASSGALTLLAAPDYEVPTDADTNNTYVVAVTATDADTNAAVQTVTVTILDLDDTAPVITGPSGAAGAASSAKSVNEGVSAVATLTASEAVTWSISGGADAAKFAINAATGALSFAAAPDYEVPTDADANNVYLVVVKATDGATNFATQTVSVTVLDLDDAAPVITGPSGAAGAANSAKSVNEGVTAVATLTASEAVTWSIGGGADAARLAINAATGALSFLTGPDFEAPTDADTNNVYVVVVTATDGSANPASQTVSVTVLNLDEIAPVITGPSGAAGAASSAISVNEGVAAVTTLGASEAVTWTITGGADAGKFGIDGATGALTFLAAPDYDVPGDADANNIYLLVATATDGAGNTGAQTVAVTVLDLDENNPVITGPSGAAGSATSAVSVNEGVTTVTTLSANEAVSWSITGGADAARFAIDGATGALTFNATTDFEAPADSDANNVYLLVVKATDGASNVSAQTVSVTVLDLDDSAPVITGPSGAPGAVSSAKSLNEGLTAVATLTASEPATWSITGGADAGRFAIDAATGALSFVVAPNFEAPTDADANNIYLVVVTATDGAANAGSQAVAVMVLNLDEDAPIISGPSGGPGAAASVISVDEGTVAVNTFTANEPVTWSITGGADAARFSVNSATGAISFLIAPDFEAPIDADNNNTYPLTIAASDAAGNLASQAVTVTVLDLDENGPAITGPSGGAGAASAAISINEAVMAVTTLAANRPVNWSISGGADAGKFAINTAGAITFLAATDFENPADANTDNVYLLVVTATDSAGKQSVQTLSVTVLDVNEAVPEITGPSGGEGAAASAVAVTEGTMAITTLHASEAVTWAIVGGSDAARLAIDPDTGAIWFRAATDYDHPADANGDNAYVIVVSATNGRGVVTRQTVSVMVRAIDAGAPVITGPSGGPGAATSSKSVDEGVIHVTAFGANEAVTWTITGGADAGRFAIDAATGALRFNEAPNFEAPADADRNNSYLLTVRARDQAGNEAAQTLTVSVTDVDEVSARVAAISANLRGNLRGYALRSLGDMLSFNEGLVRETVQTCNEPRSDSQWSRGLNVSEASQDSRVDWTKTRCGAAWRVVANAGLALSHSDGEWTRRAFGSMRIEREIAANLTVGVGVLGSSADESLASFDDSSMSDRSLQVQGYVRAQLTSELRAGAFAGVGRSWYEFDLGQDGLRVASELTGRRHIYGAMLSGDMHLGGVLFTTDMVLSRAEEDLGEARLAASFEGESRNIALRLGSVDTTRLSIPVTTEFSLVDSEKYDGRAARLLLSPGLLCEDASADESRLNCGYQIGGRLTGRLGDHGGAYLEYRFESVDGMDRSMLAIGFADRFGYGDKLEWALDFSSGMADDVPDSRAMFHLRIQP
ncbi:MAG TPA: hypothetical protein VIO94_11470 [Phenylobacterium sp.]